MAIPGTRWLLSILLVLPKCAAPSGLPHAPSAPQCHIPVEEHAEEVVTKTMSCVWNPGPDPQTPTTYTLCWESGSDRGQIKGTRVNGSIPRSKFTSHSELRVWVQAENQHGSTNSPEVSFNTGDIKMSLTPRVDNYSQDPLQIYWKSRCEQLGSSEGHCEVRHRAETDQTWHEESGTFSGTYALENVEPDTDYEFEVRCTCLGHLISDWSTVYRKRSEAEAPVGQLDVWRDCAISSRSYDCVLMLKELPRQQARGHILGYDVKRFNSNGTLLHMTRAEERDQFVCDNMRCHLNSSLKGVAAVTVSAYSALGATSPAYLDIPVPGKQNDEQAVGLRMNSESLTVSWDPPPQLSDNLKEYVVQYKQAGLSPVEGFDWIRVNKSQVTGTLKGQFKNYTAFEVSVFAVTHDGNTRHLSSVIGYSRQGTPSTVSSFNIGDIEATHVTLFWEPVPVAQRRGVILYYQIGVDSQVYNVSVSPGQETMTYLLENLSPGRDYVVWLRAVTEAGPGLNATTDFKTKYQVSIGYGITLLLITTFVVLAVLVCVAINFFRAENEACPLMPLCCNEKVPDPRNSHIFRQMKHQFNDSLAWICVPISEPHPNISQLEIVERPPETFESRSEKSSCSDGLPGQLVGDERSHMDGDEEEEEEAVGGEGRGKTDKCGRGDYSKMIDSDEENDEDSLSSLEEEEFISGYEKHFMPTAVEVMEG